jgi:hypothetical protein
MDEFSDGEKAMRKTRTIEPNFSDPGVHVRSLRVRWIYGLWEKRKKGKKKTKREGEDTSGFALNIGFIGKSIVSRNVLACGMRCSQYKTLSYG